MPQSPQGGGLLLSTAAQIGIAQGNLLRRNADLVHALAHFGHHAAQAGLHALQRSHQAADLVMSFGDTARQIALRHGFQHAVSLGYGEQYLVANEQPAAHGQRQAQHHQRRASGQGLRLRSLGLGNQAVRALVRRLQIGAGGRCQTLQGIAPLGAHGRAVVTFLITAAQSLGTALRHVLVDLEGLDQGTGALLLVRQGLALGLGQKGLGLLVGTGQRFFRIAHSLLQRSLVTTQQLAVARGKLQPVLHDMDLHLLDGHQPALKNRTEPGFLQRP